MKSSVMCNLRVILLVLFCCAGAGSAYEVRVWEDVNGNQYKGAFLRELFGKLTIQVEDGGTKTFRLEELSDLDQKYLRVKVPPKIEVDVRSKTHPVPSRPVTTKVEEFREAHQITISITKKSQRPFTSRLIAEMFLVAEEVEGDHHILLGRTERSFLMPTISKGSELELKSRPVKTLQFRDLISKAMKGEDFAGYLVVISTLDGDIVLIDSNLPSWIEDPQVIENLRELYRTGAASVRSRHFDTTGQKVPPPRPNHSGPTQL